MMQGNFGAVSGLHTKFKSVLIKKMGGQDTPEKRKELIEKEAEKFKGLLFRLGLAQRWG